MEGNFYYTTEINLGCGRRTIYQCMGIVTVELEWMQLALIVLVLVVVLAI
jgi:hypothetical protein